MRENILATGNIIMLKQTIKNLLPSDIWKLLRSCRVAYNEMYSYIAIKRIQRKISKYNSKVVTHNYCGNIFNIFIADPLAEDWYDKELEELEEIKLLKTGKLKEGAKVFNIGAHQGVVAMVLCKCVGGNGEVVAVEPNYFNTEIAKINFKNNDINNIQMLHAAIASKSGRVSINQSLNASVDNGLGNIEVDSYTIDELSVKYGMPDIIFIDVEGYECEALKGASKTLAYRPDCFIEIHVKTGLEKYNGRVEEIFSLFPPNIYTKYVCPQTSKAFEKYRSGDLFPNERFFLVAINKTSVQDKNLMEK